MSWEGIIADEPVMSEALAITDELDTSVTADELIIEEPVIDEASIVADDDDWAKADVASTVASAVPAMSRRIIFFLHWGARRAAGLGA
jgi:hypothetical protein